MDLGGLEPSHIQAFFSEMVSEPKKAASSSIKRRAWVLGDFFKYCQDNLRLADFANLTKETALKIRETTPIVNRSRKTLTKVEAKRLRLAPLLSLESAEGNKKAILIRDALLIEIALQTGATSSEIVSLRRSDIQISESASTIAFGEMDLRREIVIDNSLRQLFGAYDKLLKLSTDDYLFFHTKGWCIEIKNGLSRQSFNEILLRYSKILGIHVSPDILRNTFIKNFQGTDQELGRILGVAFETAGAMRRSIQPS